MISRFKLTEDETRRLKVHVRSLKNAVASLESRIEGDHTQSFGVDIDYVRQETDRIVSLWDVAKVRF